MVKRLDLLDEIFTCGTFACLRPKSRANFPRNITIISYVQVQTYEHIVKLGLKPPPFSFLFIINLFSFVSFLHMV